MRTHETPRAEKLFPRLPGTRTDTRREIRARLPGLPPSEAAPSVQLLLGGCSHAKRAARSFPSEIRTNTAPAVSADSGARKHIARHHYEPPSVVCIAGPYKRESTGRRLHCPSEVHIRTPHTRVAYTHPVGRDCHAFAPNSCRRKCAPPRSEFLISPHFFCT